MSQTERVLAQLRKGPVAAVAFQPPGVIDGGAPIWRIAARVRNLKDRGYEILSERLPDGTAVYRLVSEPDVERADGPPASAAASIAPRPDAVAPVGSLSAGLFDATTFEARGSWKDAT